MIALLLAELVTLNLTITQTKKGQDFMLCQLSLLYRLCEDGAQQQWLGGGDAAEGLSLKSRAAGSDGDATAQEECSGGQPEGS